MKADLCDRCLVDGVFRPRTARLRFRGDAAIDLCRRHATDARGNRSGYSLEAVRSIRIRAEAAYLGMTETTDTETRPVPVIADLEAFKRRAAELGAEMEEIPALPDPDGKPRPAFRAWASAPRGGCGEPDCRCSPGLWVSAAGPDGAGVTAHFGTDYKRGGAGDWTDGDRDRFRRLVWESGAEGA